MKTGDVSTVKVTVYMISQESENYPVTFIASMLTNIIQTRLLMVQCLFDPKFEIFKNDGA